MTTPFVGIQMGSHSIFDEGVEHVLETVRRTAQVNTLLVYSHTYQRFTQSRPSEGLADHGRGSPDGPSRNLTHVWVKPHDEYYGPTFLRHRRLAEEEYADRDILDELSSPARRRGMKVYARFLEGHGPFLASYLPNWPKVLTVDVYGRQDTLPCWNNPAYADWLVATVQDLVSSYQLDGFMYGAERSGPLPNLLAAGRVPSCFCEHCRAAGRSDGIDASRAIEGFTRLHQFVLGCASGERPVDGYLVSVLRILAQYPEILRWEYAWHKAKERVARRMYGVVKAIAPTVEVGWHVYHAVTWDPIYQAEMDYAEMVSYSDWLKPVVYHDIAGVRIRNRYLIPLSTTVGGDTSATKLCRLLFESLGYDPDHEAELDALPTTGMSPGYVEREVRRCVAAVEGRIPVYAGVGFDVPTDGNPMRSSSRKVYDATRAAFAGGAAGLLVSREYDEMRLENLEAVGRAIDDARAHGQIA